MNMPAMAVRMVGRLYGAGHRGRQTGAQTLQAAGAAQPVSKVRPIRHR